MPSLKDNIQIQSTGAILAAQEGVYKVRSGFAGLPLWERVMFIVGIALVLPGAIALRYGTELYLTKQYARQTLVAQNAFKDPDQIQTSKVNIIQNVNGSISAYAVIKNPNLDLALDDLSYTVNFFNSAGEQIATNSGKTYLLPNQQKWLVVPKVTASEPIASAKLELGNINWLKRLSLPDVELKTSEPAITEEVNPLATVTEGSVVNNSALSLGQVSLILVLYNSNKQVIAITTREEFALKPFERRAYKIQWPSISKDSVASVGLEAYTNTLDPTNFSVDTTSQSSQQ